MKKNTLNVIGVITLILVIMAGFFLLSSPGIPDSQFSLTTQSGSPQIGINTLVISVHDETGKPVDNAKVNSTVNMATMDMGAQKSTATSLGNGQYTINSRFSMRGPWKISAAVTYPNGKQFKKDFALNVQ